MPRKSKGRAVHGILLLDKPAGGSSNKVLQKVKRLYHARKAGHTGSLDPLATGMLPICLGEATKISAYLLAADKGYEVTLKLGETTNSADSDGELLQKRPVPQDLSETAFNQVCDAFRGSIEQIPPMVSAIKIDGQRLYKLARQGQDIERPARAVTIHALNVLSYSSEFARLFVRCSKGTYIRSLVSDIGEAIGCGAHVTALRRTFVSPFEQQPMIDFSTLELMSAQIGDEEPEPSPEAAWQALDTLLLPLDAALAHLPAVNLLSEAQLAFSSGQPASCVETDLGKPGDEEFEPEPCRVYGVSGQLLGLGERFLAHEGIGAAQSLRVAPRRVFQWD